MGHRVIGKTEELFRGYGPRKGLEGPFYFEHRGVLYYDKKEGQYWDPKSDFYVDKTEMAEIIFKTMNVE